MGRPTLKQPWRSLRARARKICRAQPGYGTAAYRGDPYDAVALYQAAERLYWEHAATCGTPRDIIPLHVQRQLDRTNKGASTK